MIKKLLSNPVFIVVLSILAFTIGYITTKKISTALLLPCGILTVYGSSTLLSERKIRYPITMGIITGISCMTFIAMLKLKFL